VRLALELVHQCRRRDRNRLAAEGEQPSRKGVNSANRELSAIGRAFHRDAELRRSACRAGARVEINEGVFGVSVAELPCLLRASVFAETEVIWNGVVSRLLPRGVHRRIMDSVDAEVAKLRFLGVASREVPV